MPKEMSDNPGDGILRSTSVINMPQNNSSSGSNQSRKEISGLTEKQVRMLQQTHGPNAILTQEEMTHESQKRGHYYVLWMKKYLQQFNNPLILLLLGSAVVSLILGQYENAISIAIAVIIVTTFAFIQESRSEAALRALHRLSPPQCLVVRDEREQYILAEWLVPGDHVKLPRGARIPADIQLTEATEDLSVDESVLTGESQGQPKDIGDKVLMGTMVLEGHGEGMVLVTGSRTELGKLTALMRSTEEPKTPLQVQLDDLGEKLTILSGVIILVIAIIGYFLAKKSLLSVFTTAVSLAVAAIPEGLPIVATITLALGVLTLARRGVLVKKLTAVEGLGSIDVLCVDKTGTLTQNCLSFDCAISLSNLGSEQIVEIACHCVDPSSPLDAILLEHFAKKGDDLLQSNNFGGNTRKIIQHFSSHTKWMAVQIKRSILGDDLSIVTTSEDVIIAKGALECLPLGIIDPSMNTKVQSLGRQGNRVLAIAIGTTCPSNAQCNRGTNDLKVIGLLCFKDEPRWGMDVTVKQLSSLGVRLLMITGDSKETAEAIGNAIHWPPGESISLSSSSSSSSEAKTKMDEGSKLLLASDDLEGVSIVYRATPQQKLQIIAALQQSKQIVAMIGDGVNDAAALKKADIGVAMGGPRATDVAREAARIVLIDDNLGSLAVGIREGRAIFRNIRCFIKFQVSVSVALLGLVALESLFPRSSTSPSYIEGLTPFQILLINIIMDGPPAQSLGVEPLDEYYKHENDERNSLLSGLLFIRSVISAMITIFLCLQQSRHRFYTLVLVTLANAFTCRSLTQSSLRLNRLFSNKALMLSMAISAGSLLIIDRFSPNAKLSLEDWVKCLMKALAFIILEELVKVIHRFSDSFSLSNKFISRRRLWKV